MEYIKNKYQQKRARERSENPCPIGCLRAEMIWLVGVVLWWFGLGFFCSVLGILLMVLGFFLVCIRFVWLLVEFWEFSAWFWLFEAIFSVSSINETELNKLVSFFCPLFSFFLFCLALREPFYNI